MWETLVLTFRQIYMSSSEYNLNCKTSVLNILCNTLYCRSKLKFFIMRYNYVIVLRIMQLKYKAFLLYTNNLVQI